MERGDEIEIIRSTDIELTREIGSGPGYLLHAGRNKSRAVIVKVFHKNPTVRQQLESTVTLSKELMHPNVLRIKGISSQHSLSRFIVYENGHCVNAEILLAAALKNDLARSITLGFTMVAEVSAGISHLCMQGVWPKSMGVANFHILADAEDRFLVLINAPQQEVKTVAPQEPEDNALAIFNGLLDKTLMSANRVLHKEKIKRDPAIPDSKRPSFVAGNSGVVSASGSQTTQVDELGVPPRREYVWRTMDPEGQTLADVSEGLTTDLKLHFHRLFRSTRTDGLSAHRCPGYVRQEITLATTILDSAVVSHDTPSSLEECPVCHEVVGLNDAFRCICGDVIPGARYTIKCRECRLWSHSDCVGNPKEFTCRLCFLESFPNFPPMPSADFSPPPMHGGHSPTDYMFPGGRNWDGTITGSNHAHDYRVEDDFTEMKKHRLSPSYDPRMAERLDRLNHISAYSHHGYSYGFNPRPVPLDIRTPEELAAVNGFLVTLGREVSDAGPRLPQSSTKSASSSKFDPVSMPGMLLPPANHPHPYVDGSHGTHHSVQPPYAASSSSRSPKPSRNPHRPNSMVLSVDPNHPGNMQPHHAEPFSPGAESFAGPTHAPMHQPHLHAIDADQIWRNFEMPLSEMQPPWVSDQTLGRNSHSQWRIDAFLLPHEYFPSTPHIW
ncbi:hypothetical protein MSAN_01229300 [Mycena sanguinolenta]|uniref:Protein kinase domain-containing protein n=1 Tax=Mycena sanguinolenta TaxID=230812 RepID=A0A8H6YD59_9AGAR|nr:hypothetical protein MSAN_01229300 [Mycena sanguinolenta]